MEEANVSKRHSDAVLVAGINNMIVTDTTACFCYVFIDQMSVLMGVENQKMSELAMKAEHVYPMAARCGVFAKTDIQNLMARNLPEADIAASIFHSIAVQTVVTLSHGISFEAPILLCGGPLTFLPALRKAFCDYLHLSPNDFIVSENSNLIPALGCAYA